MKYCCLLLSANEHVIERECENVVSSAKDEEEMKGEQKKQLVCICLLYKCDRYIYIVLS